MNDFEKRWEEKKQRWESKIQNNQRHGHVFTGLIILLIGVAALLKALNVLLPHWLLSWPMLIIIIGIFTGIKSGFRGSSWILMILFGGIFLTGQIIPDLSARKFIWPAILIILGIVFIVRPQSGNCSRKVRAEKKTSSFSNIEEATVVDESQNSKEDFLDTTSIFGGIKKNILSKNFKGGQVTNVMGGSELNFTQADIKGEVTIQLTQVFGGTKIVVPSDWDVKSDIVAIFGGIEDKRTMENNNINPDKALVLKGTSVFAGIEIRNF